MLATLSAHLLAATQCLIDRARPEPGDDDRGDVPGWVLITVMTAGLVTALWVVAAPQLRSFFQSAINGVHGP